MNKIEKTIVTLFKKIYSHKYGVIDFDVSYDEVKDKYLVNMSDDMYDSWVKKMKEKNIIFSNLNTTDFYRMVEDVVYSDLKRISQYLNKPIDVKIKKK